MHLPFSPSSGPRPILATAALVRGTSRDRLITLATLLCSFLIDPCRAIEISKLIATVVLIAEYATRAGPRLLSPQPPTMPSTIHTGLPEDVISQILASFCDGKSTSTFFQVLWSGRTYRSTSFDIIRDALVHRYKSLASDDRLQLDRCEEIRDILDIVREDIRTSSIDSDTGQLAVREEDLIVQNKTIITLVSEWGAIADYFQITIDLNEYVVWIGEISTRFGRLDAACIRTPFWSLTALEFFYQQLELGCEALVPPIPSSNFSLLLDHPFGHLRALTDEDAQVMDRMRNSMSFDDYRSALVPSTMEYDLQPAFAFCPTINDRASNFMLQQERELGCLWDGRDDCDFDESLAHLGDHSIRILKRLELAKNTDVGGRAISWELFIGSDLAQYDGSTLS